MEEAMSADGVVRRRRRRPGADAECWLDQTNFPPKLRRMHNPHPKKRSIASSSTDDNDECLVHFFLRPHHVQQSNSDSNSI